MTSGRTDDERSSLLGRSNGNTAAIHYGVEHMQLSGQPSDSFYSDNDAAQAVAEEDDLISTFASVAGNALELYDFALYGYFSDVIGAKFFPPTDDESTSVIESFLVFGGAFLVRPVGGVLMGYIGEGYCAMCRLTCSCGLERAADNLHLPLERRRTHRDKQGTRSAGRGLSRSASS